MKWIVGYAGFVTALLLVAVVPISISYCDDLNKDRRCMGLRAGSWYLILANLERSNEER